MKQEPMQLALKEQTEWIQREFMQKEIDVSWNIFWHLKFSFGPRRLKCAWNCCRLSGLRGFLSSINMHWALVLQFALPNEKNLTLNHRTHSNDSRVLFANDEKISTQNPPQYKVSYMKRLKWLLFSVDNIVGNGRKMRTVERKKESFNYSENAEKLRGWARKWCHS